MIVNHFVEQSNKKGEVKNLFLQSVETDEVKIGDEFPFEAVWYKVVQMEFKVNKGLNNLEVICHEVLDHGTYQTQTESED